MISKLKNKDPLNILPWKIRKDFSPIVLLTGAGISISAGLPDAYSLAYELLKICSHDLSHDDIDIKPIADFVPLETIFQALADQNNINAIQSIIERIDLNHPSVPHIASARLCELGLLRRIYTFNFDTLHEQAFSNVNNLETPNLGRTIAKKLSLESGNSVILYKVHGSAESAGVITLSEYIQGFSQAFIDLLAKDLDGQYWLIVGYGGWDLDFQQALFNIINSGVLPREVVWIDKEFPDEGGRTDILKNFESLGVITTKENRSFNYFFNSIVESNINFNSNYKIPLDIILESLFDIPKISKARAIVQLSFLIDDLNYCNSILSSLENIMRHDEQWLYWKAYFEERSGNYDYALKLYEEAVYLLEEIGKKTLSVMKAFTLSKGKIDIFDNINLSLLPTNIKPFFNLIKNSRRTDTGGLNREIAIKWCKQLPSTQEISQWVPTSDWIRFLISALNEIARLNHESGNYEVALELDLQAMRLAEALLDPSLLSMSVGNVGACYMEISKYSETNKTDIKSLEIAKKYLKRAVELAKNSNKFSYSLHLCNLGVVKCNLADFKNGIKSLSKGIKILEKCYPNYAVCFYGELGSIYSKAAIIENSVHPVFFSYAAVKAIERGIELADKLSDWDDVHFLEHGIENLKKNSRISNEVVQSFELKIKSKVK